jgi:SH3-like domain-containing protein
VTPERFRPTHHVPRGGMLTWDAPDPSRAASNRLDADVPVQMLEETTGWGRVRCSNGWETWVAAPELVPIPFRPTHAVREAGVDARLEPVASRLPDAQLAAGLPVEVLEDTSGWSHVRCSNGWEAWVDGRALVPARRNPVAAGPLNPVALVAVGLPALLVILGSVLAWYSILSQSINAWDIEVVALFTHDDGGLDLKTGPVLLVLALATLVLVVVRLPRSAATVAFGCLGGAMFVIGVAGVFFYLEFPEPRPDLGIGLVLTIVAGLAVAVAGVLVEGSRPRT